MAIPTDAEMLEAYKGAELRLINGAQQVRFGDRMLTKADLQWIQAGVDRYERKVQAAAPGHKPLQVVL